MKLTIKYNQTEIGTIYPKVASKKTREINGLLIPNDNYLNVRPDVIKYYDIFHSSRAKNVIDKFLNKRLEKKYEKFKTWFNSFRIYAGDIEISDAGSEICIVDNLSRTGRGNIEIQIEAWNLITDELTQDFDLYSIQYLYPFEPQRIIQIKHRDQVILEH